MRVAVAAATISLLQCSAAVASPLSSETSLVNTRFNRVIDLLTSLKDELDDGGDELRSQLLAALHEDEAAGAAYLRGEEGIVDSVLHAVKHIVHPVTHLVRCLVKCVTHVVDYSDEEEPDVDIGVTGPTDAPEAVISTPDIATLLRNPWSQQRTSAPFSLAEEGDEESLYSHDS